MVLIRRGDQSEYAQSDLNPCVFHENAGDVLLFIFMHGAHFISFLIYVHYPLSQANAVFVP